MSEPTPIAPFQGGRKLMLGGAVVGVLGLAATFLGGLDRAMPSYLVAFLYVFGLAVGATIMIAIFHAAGGQWMTVLRRQMEHLSTLAWPALLMFVPIYLFRDKLFVWTFFEHGRTAPPEVAARMSQEFAHLMHSANTGKAIWLSSPFFLARAGLAIGAFALYAFLFNRLSLKQDGMAPDPGLRQRLRVIASPGLIVLAFACSIAGIDWLMNLEPEWVSAMIGVYYFAASFISAWAMMALLTALPTDQNLPAARVSGEHLHQLGKFMLAFTSFWAYISYSQLVIIYSANIPEEVPWYFARGLAGLSPFTTWQHHPDAAAGAWFPVLMFLVLGHFLLPWMLLLPMPWKRSRKFLTVIAVWLLFAHYVDLYFWVMPAMRFLHPDLAGPHPAWQDFTAMLGLGGLAVAFVVWRMRGKAAVPVNDPTLPYSLKYLNPL